MTRRSAETLIDVYITTRTDDGNLRGIIRVLDTHEVLDVTEPVNPPHQAVARARAADLFRERSAEWRLMPAPRERI